MPVFWRHFEHFESWDRIGVNGIKEEYNLGGVDGEEIAVYRMALSRNVAMGFLRQENMGNDTLGGCSSPRKIQSNFGRSPVGESGKQRFFISFVVLSLSTT